MLRDERNHEVGLGNPPGEAFDQGVTRPEFAVVDPDLAAPALQTERQLLSDSPVPV